MEVNDYKKYLDVSGNIKGGDFYIGSILFNERYRKNFFIEFHKNFPNLKSYEAKGATLKKPVLKEVISFLNDKKIPMTCLYFSKQKMDDAEALVKCKIKTLTCKDQFPSSFNEKIAGVLYYYNLKYFAKQNYIYQGHVCMESQVNIKKVLSELFNISKRDNYLFRLVPTLRDYEHLLKIADYVASAGRKIEWTFLDELKYFKMIAPDITDFDINHAFRLHKLRDEMKKKEDF